MENNKILIGVQFTESKASSSTGRTGGDYHHIQIELYVLRDILLSQLIDGIRYGIQKLASVDGPYRSTYQTCERIFNNCCQKIAADEKGKACFSHITYTSFNNCGSTVSVYHGRPAFLEENKRAPLYSLGFITSTRIIFDETGIFPPDGMHDTSNIIEAFNPRFSTRERFPEYNISTRTLYQFDEKPVDIITPPSPPKKNDEGLFSMLFSAVLPVLAMSVARSFFTGGVAMLGISAAMAVPAAVMAFTTKSKRDKAYKTDLYNWKTQYQDYIDRTIKTIVERQTRDRDKMDELYPDMLRLINRDNSGVYSLNGNIYSRAPQDRDFLSFRIGISDMVPSVFEIKGERKETIFSEASYELISNGAGGDSLKMYVNEELHNNLQGKENLSYLPGDLAERYRYLKDAPLLYSLKDKGALGIVDAHMADITSKTQYFLSRMIFELCYYHSPENLQFIVFYNHSTEWNTIENTIKFYKYMPHFRGLFDDKSQFVFDNQAAASVMSSLLTIMSRRRAAASEEKTVPTPHIVMIVYEDYGLKEHAFAEYLPEAPQEGTAYHNDLGLTFVFPCKYKEYLPAYCDDVINFNQDEMTLTPRENARAFKTFRYPEQHEVNAFFAQYITAFYKAAQFFSTVFYAQIAQNGKVPSSVGYYELYDRFRDGIEETVSKFWGMKNGTRPLPPITKSLSVPIGKTETGTAYLDLHEKADGPHMLVAGTTGSGKTETVITFLIGLCLQYRPDEVNLLLVDMKGGGFTKRLGHLPHVVGAVTDVDGDENGTGAEYMLGRFLSAMTSEIKRRKLLLNRLRVDSADAYIAACRDIEAHILKKNVPEDEAERMRRAAKDDPLSHLILVVDEFTELKRFSNENNDIDYMGEITTIARIGRSLGIHIILISQNIEGAITDDIRVNSKARLCLKVATRQASKDMIGTELAASPSMPGNGRAYLLVGTGSKFEYFQSGYAGGDVEEDIPVEITLANKSGSYSQFYYSASDNRELVERTEAKKKSGASKTQLDTITQAICAVYEENKQMIPVPHQVFTPPLPTCAALDESHHYVNLSDRKER